GLRHSEINANRDAEVRFLQIWILPAVSGLEPSYEQKHFDDASRRGQLRLVASPDGRSQSLTVHQDVDLYVSLLERGESVEHAAAAGRRLYLHLARGAVTLNGHALHGGDGVAISDERTLRIEATESSELLLFDLA
ncbi:MAG: pirin family protein, partial [Myxococcales bacterium]|nr:pirin family protein [Myxococcales bacterium]